MDEYVKGSTPLTYDISISNNSSYPVTDISLDFVDPTVSNYNFAVNSEGRKEFPGGGGTCVSELLSPGEECLIKIQFSALTSGQISQTLRLRYNNIVEPGDESFGLTIFSGTPASLIFDPDELNYHFGNLTGISQTPLVERDTPEKRTKNLIIKNSGELRARGLSSTLFQSCSSRLTKSCPIGQNNSFRVLSNSCPENLEQNETCEIQIEFENLNQGVDPELRNIAFSATLTNGYVRDPKGNFSALSAYIKSTSANIEAYFESSLATIQFQDPIVVGNREKKSFRVKNTGYREGYLRKFLIYEEGNNSLAFYCQKEADPILKCYDTDDNPITLQHLPLFFVDTQACMNQSMNNEILNDSGCQFDVYLQPSNTYLENGEFAYDIRFEFDSRFKGQETILTSPEVELNITGEWFAAARLVFTELSIGNDLKTINNLIRVTGLGDGGSLSLSGGTFYSVGKSDSLSDIKLIHGDFLKSCEPRYDKTGSEIGYDVTFSDTLSGTINGKFYQNYMGGGPGFLIDSSSNGVIEDDTLISFQNCELVGWNDLGRLAMELWNFYKRDKFEIRFTNKGGVSAKNIQLKDGSGTIVPEGVATNIGISSNNCSSSNSDKCPFYANVVYNCGTLVANDSLSCSIVFDFSPIKRESDIEADSLVSMFDFQGITPYENYKSFNISYENGALFTDSNLDSETPDIVRKEIDYYLHGILVNKGYIADVEVVLDRADSEVVVGEYNYKIFFMRNIGAGSIPYIEDSGITQNVNVDIISLSSLPSGVMPTPLGSDIDCSTIIDFRTSKPDPITTLGSLSSGQGCYLALRYQATNEDKANPTSLYSGDFDELDRIFNYSLTSDELWEYADSFGINADFQINYYDGDITNEYKEGQYSDSFGQEFALETDVTNVALFSPSHVIPVNPRPAMTSVMSRPQFIKNDLLNNAADAVLYSGNLVERTWFYGHESLALKDSATVPLLPNASDENDALYAYKSIDRLKGLSVCNDCELSIHFGTFERGQEHILSFDLTNRGKAKVNIDDYDLTNSSGLFSLASVGESFPSFPSPIIAGDIIYQNGTAIKEVYRENFFKKVVVKFNPSVSDNGVFRAFLEYDVDTKESANADRYSEPNKIRTYKIELIAETVDPNLLTKLELDQQQYDVTTYENMPPTESLSVGRSSLESGKDIDLYIPTVSNVFSLEMVRTTDLDAYSGYVKKRLNVKVTNRAISNLEIFYKDSPTSTDRVPMADISFLEITEDTCSGQAHTVDSECHIDFKYQPGLSAVQRDFVLSLAYEYSDNQYRTQNVLMRTLPQIPGELIPALPEHLNTYGGVDALNDPTAYALNLGTIYYDVQNKTIEFKNIEIDNESDDFNASFLKSYQLHKGITDKSVYPPAGDWFYIDGKEYVIIQETFYDSPYNLSPRFTISASKECIYGDLFPDDPDFGTIDDEDRGFQGANSGCELHARLIMDANYIGVGLNNRALLEIMENNYIKLFYYSYKRIETSYISFYFNGTVKPDTYSKESDMYNIYAFDDKSIEFAFDEVTENNSLVGALQGYRIFYSSSPILLDDVVGNNADYLTTDVDTPGDGGQVLIEIDSNNLPTISRGEAFYFKVLAIRHNPNYTRNAYPGLGPGEYLSEGDLPILRVVVPEFDHVYLHDLQAMVKKDVERDNGSNLYGPFSYAQSHSACAENPSVTIYDPTSPKGSREYNLIDEQVWEALRVEPSFSSYAGGEDPLRVPHWLTSPHYNIDSIFSGVAGYDSNSNSQRFDTLESFYFRCTDGCLTNRKMGGGFLSESFRDYISFIGDSVPLGYARCYTDISK